MRQLFVALVATAAIIASQNPAQAVYVKTLVDNFTTPPSSTDVSIPGGTLNDDLAAPAEAASRTLFGAGPIGSQLEAGSGLLLMDIGGNQGSNLIGGPIRIVYDVAAIALMPTNNLILLTGLNAVAGAVNITAYADATSLGTVTYAGGIDTVSWAKTPGAFNELTLVFDTNGTIGFNGSATGVVANPEPATMALMGLGVLGGAIGYRRRRQDDEVTPLEDPAPAEA